VMCLVQTPGTITGYSELPLKLSTKGNPSMLKLALRYARYAIVTLSTIGFALTSN